MTASIPHYLLFAESAVEPSTTTSGCAAGGEVGRWRIALEAVDGSWKFEVSDEEEASAERLELLAVVRGLEAIPEPAKVTLVTSSRYVSRGLRFGLAEWRENGWQWERFGEMSAVVNGDLWQRLDRALAIHQVQCRTWRFDSAHTTAPGVVPAPHSNSRGARQRNTRRPGTRRAFEAVLCAS